MLTFGDPAPKIRFAQCYRELDYAKRVQPLRFRALAECVLERRCGVNFDLRANANRFPDRKPNPRQA